MMDLMPNLGMENGQPLYVQLYRYIREEIIQGRLEQDEKLPSIRRLSKSLAISRTTIENAYQQLLVEGYLYSLPQKGYYVSAFDKTYVNHQETQVVGHPQARIEDSIQYDFKNEYVEVHNFDFNLWRKYMNRVLNYDSHKLYKANHIQGEEELRQEIVRYLRRSRGVTAEPHQIIVGSGGQYLLNILSTLLKQMHIRECAFEDPGFNRAKNIFIHNDFNIVPIPVEAQGLNLEVLRQSQAKLCYVSPSHQFPTGMVMSIDQRIQLLKWASDNKGYIIEDDYNSELRYSGKPIPSMQSFDKDNRVIYLGSFSTVLVPAIRISYMILPNGLFDLYHQNKYRYTQTTSKTEQLALATFMGEGMFEKHIRRLKKNYAKKNTAIIQAVRTYMDEHVTIGGMDSGLHLLLTIKTSLTEQEIVKMAYHKAMLLFGMSEYRIAPREDPNPIMILSYRGIPSEKIDEAIKLLKEITIK